MNEEQIIVQYDPDFDEMQPTPKNSTLLESISPEKVFWAGFAISLLVLMSLGFLILGGMLLSGRTLSL